MLHLGAALPLIALMLNPKRIPQQKQFGAIVLMNTVRTYLLLKPGDSWFDKIPN